MVFKAIMRVLLTAVALMGIAYIIPGITISNFTTALLAALVWGLLTLLVRPVLLLLTLPITILTLGLSIFVLNAFLFWCTALVVSGFHVAGFLPAVAGSLILAVVGWCLHALF